MNARIRWRRTVNWLRVLVLAVLAPAVARQAVAAGGLEFSKDTIWEECYSGGKSYHDTVFLRNTTQDTLVVDTILVLVDTYLVVLPYLEMDIIGGPLDAFPNTYLVLSHPPCTNSVAEYGRSCQMDCPVRVPPRDSLYLLCVNIDPCISCPTAGAVSEPLPPPSDPIWATLVFLAGAASDTLVVRGIIGTPPIPVSVHPHFSSSRAGPRSLQRAGVAGDDRWLLNGQMYSDEGVQSPDLGRALRKVGRTQRRARTEASHE